MKTENCIWYRTGVNGSDLYTSTGQHVGVIFSEQNAQLCAAAPFMRDCLERISTLPAEYVSGRALGIVKDALAVCEVRNGNDKGEAQPPTQNL